MVNFKLTHKYRDCTVIIDPVKEAQIYNVSIFDDLSGGKILEECLPEEVSISTARFVTECDLFIDNYIERVESLGKVK